MILKVKNRHSTCRQSHKRTDTFDIGNHLCLQCQVVNDERERAERPLDRQHELRLAPNYALHTCTSSYHRCAESKLWRACSLPAIVLICIWSLYVHVTHVSIAHMHSTRTWVHVWHGWLDRHISTGRPITSSEDQLFAHFSRFQGYMRIGPRRYYRLFF